MHRNDRLRHRSPVALVSPRKLYLPTIQTFLSRGLEEGRWLQSLLIIHICIAHIQIFACGELLAKVGFTALTYLSCFKLNDAGVEDFWLRQEAARSKCCRQQGLRYCLLCSFCLFLLNLRVIGSVQVDDGTKAKMTGSLFRHYLVWDDNRRATTDAHDWQRCLRGEEVQDLCHFCHLKTKQIQ